jgi:hypothetical protein
MPNGNEPPKPHRDKWPWSVTDREFGALEQELKELRHDFRNLRSIVELAGVITVTKEDMEDLKKSITNYGHQRTVVSSLEEKCDAFNTELIKLKIKVYTAFSVIGVLSAVVVWLSNVASQAFN